MRRRSKLGDYWFYLNSAVDPDEFPELRLLDTENERQDVIKAARKVHRWNRTAGHS